MATEWYCAKDGQQTGPMELAQLQRMLGSGHLSAGDLVWNASMPNWLPAAEVPELRSAGGHLADPIPVIQPSPQTFINYQGQSMESVAATARALDMLRETRPWVRFVSVLMFVAVGLMILSGLVLLVIAPPVGCVALVVYGIASLFQIFPGIYLGRYATKISEVLQYRRPQDLEAALEAQKSFWKFVGIVLAVILGIYALLFLLLIVAGGFAAFR